MWLRIEHYTHLANKKVLSTVQERHLYQKGQNRNSPIDRKNYNFIIENISSQYMCVSLFIQLCNTREDHVIQQFVASWPSVSGTTVHREDVPLLPTIYPIPLRSDNNRSSQDSSD